MQQVTEDQIKRCKNLSSLEELAIRQRHGLEPNRVSPKRLQRFENSGSRAQARSYEQGMAKLEGMVT